MDIHGFAGVKETRVEANGTGINVAVISGLHNAEPIIKKIIEGVDVGYDLIEIMADASAAPGTPCPKRSAPWLPASRSLSTLFFKKL